MAIEVAQPCNVCAKPIDGRAVDVQLGPVCIGCKVGLRWAHFWLSKEETGISNCTNKHHYRTKKK